MLRAASSAADVRVEQLALEAVVDAVWVAGGVTGNGKFIHLSVAILVVDEILGRGRELIESDLLPRLDSRLGGEAAAVAQEEIERLFGELADWFRERVGDGARR